MSTKTLQKFTHFLGSQNHQVTNKVTRDRICCLNRRKQICVKNSIHERPPDVRGFNKTFLVNFEGLVRFRHTQRFTRTQPLGFVKGLSINCGDLGKESDSSPAKFENLAYSPCMWMTIEIRLRLHQKNSRGLNMRRETVDQFAYVEDFIHRTLCLL